MSKIKKMFASNKVMGSMAAFALLFSTISANSCCAFIFHQPEKPDFGKLRKY